jgi:hypothetical protein
MVLFHKSFKNKNKFTFFPKILKIVWVSELRTRKEMCISKLGTGKEKWFQNMGPEKNFTLRSQDRKKIMHLRIGTGNIFPVPCFESTILFRSQFLDQNSFPVLTFESKILFGSSLLRYTFLFRSPILRHTLSLEFLGKCKFLFNFKVLEEKNHATVISG